MRSSWFGRRRSGRRLGAAVVAFGLIGSGFAPGPAVATPTPTPQPGNASVKRLADGLRGGHDGPGLCPPRAAAYHFSDALDQTRADGVTVGGLSDVAYDRRQHSFVSSVDNHLDDPSRLWFYRDLHRPRIWRAPLVLKTRDGIPYTGETADNEGLAVLPDGRFMVSSETEPSIRIFGRNGVQQSQLEIPARFRVAPAGESTANATLEGLTISPDGRTVVAAMEGTLSGDAPADGGPANYRRFLVYTRDHGQYTLTKQLGYRVEPGLRIAEVQAYRDGKLLVLEAQYTPQAGNVIKLYAVSGPASAADVSGIADLSTAASAVTTKTLIADVTRCPTLGATARQPQANPLMDNYEGMITRSLGHRLYRVTLISDNNFNPTQVTRTLDLVAVLP